MVLVCVGGIAVFCDVWCWSAQPLVLVLVLADWTGLVDPAMRCAALRSALGQRHRRVALFPHSSARPSPTVPCSTPLCWAVPTPTTTSHSRALHAHRIAPHSVEC